MDKTQKRLSTMARPTGQTTLSGLQLLAAGASELQQFDCQAGCSKQRRRHHERVF